MKIARTIKTELGRWLMGVRPSPQPGGCLRAALAMVVLVFSVGGGARPDIDSAPLLRAVASIVLAFALTGLTSTKIRQFRGLLALAVCCLLLPVVHYIPLPPGIANSLHGHEIIAEIDRGLGTHGIWRPATMSPQWTLNAIFALTVPTSVLLLAIRLNAFEHERLAIAICLIGALSAILAMLQIQGPANGPLYFYQITNNGSAVGLFANRNHQAVFLACLFPIGSAILARRHSRRAAQVLRQRFFSGPIASRLSVEALKSALTASLVAVFLLPMIFVTGSRAGLLAALIALLSFPFVFKMSKDRASAAAPAGAATWLIRWLLLALLPLVIGLAIWLDRVEAIDRLVASSPSDEMRIKILPVMYDMIRLYWPWGSGMGTFQKVYQVYEPYQLLAPTYMNHAHNDWLEVIMTGGAPALVFLAVACGGWAWSAYRIVAAGEVDRFQPYRRAAIVVVFIFAAASLTDYPLRTPSLAVLFTVCAVWLCVPFEQHGIAGPAQPTNHSPGYKKSQLK